jgi:Domain of unknown function (DUF3806)
MRKISGFTDEMTEYVGAKRDWVKNHYSSETIDDYNTVAGKLILLDTILKSNWIESQETEKLQSLGITLGDIFVQDMNFIWVEVEDEYGNDPAIQLPDTTIILFPMTMISKRIEGGEEVDIYDLYEGLKKKVKEIKNETQ